MFMKDNLTIWFIPTKFINFKRKSFILTGEPWWFKGVAFWVAKKKHNRRWWWLSKLGVWSPKFFWPRLLWLVFFPPLSCFKLLKKIKKINELIWRTGRILILKVKLDRTDRHWSDAHERWEAMGNFVSEDDGTTKMLHKTCARAHTHTHRNTLPA